MFNPVSSASDSMKLIRFFRIVGVLGGIALFFRLLIFITILGGILSFLP